MPNPTLLDALHRLQGKGPEYQDLFANHGPMAAEALTQLGFDSTVAGWVDNYRLKLSDAPPTSGLMTAATWRAHLGDIRVLGDWIQVFRRELEETHWQDVLATWWPRLLPGLAASATHGVIRTAHGIRQLACEGPEPDPALLDELAQGLGYWAARYQSLPGNPGLVGDEDAVAAIRDLPRLSPDEPSVGDGIAGRLGSLVRLPGLPSALDRWAPTADLDLALDDLIGAAARILAARDDAPIAFCHAVTAPAAVRMALPSLPERLHRPTVAVTWQVVAGIVSAYASPRSEDEQHRVETDPQPLLDDLPSRAAEHGDEHVIKLTEAVLREYPRTKDTTLLVAADRFRNRIEPA
jgi:hypothetical protein